MGVMRCLQDAASRFLSSSSAGRRPPPVRQSEAGTGRDTTPRANAGAGATTLEAVLAEVQQQQGGALEQAAAGVMHAGLVRAQAAFWLAGICLDQDLGCCRRGLPSVQQGCLAASDAGAAQHVGAEQAHSKAFLTGSRRGPRGFLWAGA